MRPLLIVLCGWLLPLLAFADAASGVTLQLVEGTYRPGDVVELQAEMRRAEYAEFELHVPAHAQLHFVAHTREPVRYVEGVYVQSVLLLLQPMNAGEFELNRITAILEQGGVSTEVALPSVQFTVTSYAAEDTSKTPAVLTGDSFITPKRTVFVLVVIVVLVVLSLVVWILLRKQKPAFVELAETLSLSDLVDALEAGEPAEDLIERSLGDAALSMSPSLREALETAAYANRIDVAGLLRALKEEVER